MDFHKSMGSLTVLAGIIAFSPSLYGFTSLRLQTSAPQNWQAVNFRDTQSPGGGGNDTRTAGAGSRNASQTCKITYNDRRKEDNLTVLMPSNNVGTTAEPNPQLYIYIPESQVEAVDVEIDDGTSLEPIYTKSFDLSNKPDNRKGIVKLDLEDFELEPGKTYKWAFRPFCLDEAGEPQHISPDLGGDFQRRVLTPQQRTELNRDLARAETPKEKAEVYAKAGLWNETLETVEQLRDSDPNAWTELLTSVNLPEEIVKAPYFGESQPLSENSSSPVTSTPPVSPETTVTPPLNSEPEEQSNAQTPIRGLW